MARQKKYWDDRPVLPTDDHPRDKLSARFKRKKTVKRVSAQQSSDEYIFGYHSVSIALNNPDRKFYQILVTPNLAEKFSNQISDRGIQLNILTSQELDKILGANVVHQGIAAKVEPLKKLNLDDCRDKSPLIILDQVTDPHNVGAILRSGAAFGARGLIMTDRNSPTLTGSLAKAASGGLELVPVILITNLARALEGLADMGFWRVGLDGDGQTSLEEALKFRDSEETHSAKSDQVNQKIALVLGAEGKGLRRLTRENCDEICRLTATGKLKSLNVSNAAAVALYVLQGFSVR